MPIKESSGVPAATYRLQLREEFPFSAASALTPYFREIGISHCYCSPILMSAAGSTHGYDVNDYHRIDVELGGSEGFANFARELQRQGMGMLLDFVPNHMGIQGTANRWWRDVLECGPNSPHADFFDIDWRDLVGAGRPRVLVPILGDQFGVVLEEGKFALEYGPGGLGVRYEENVFPLSPSTYARLLGAAAEQPVATREASAALRALAETFYRVSDPISSRQTIDSAPRAELKRRLAATIAEHDTARRAVEDLLETLNGRIGAPPSFDLLEQILGEQHYRLAHWRTGAHEVNYRRFFAIDTLIGLRMENPKVFEETHRLIGGLIRAGLVAGLRIDHIDGLRNPREYLERVQALARDPENAVTRPLYAVVEKILAVNETLDDTWPIHGDTGYEFIQQLSGLLVDPNGEEKMSAVYAQLTGQREAFPDVVYTQKRLVLEELFANAVTQLAQHLADLVTADRLWRDLTRYELTVAIREIMACLGVYRIYREMGAACRPEDAREIERACSEAVRRNPRSETQPFEFVRELLLGRYPPPTAAVEYRVGLWRWVLTFQQYTGAVMAKSVEDTAFYVYNRMIALNEVGGNPIAFGADVAEFHAKNVQRQASAPHGLLTTSTHDTKFGEDVRARLYVLSEIPDEWAQWVAHWRQLNQRHKTALHGREAPDANEEYRFYQILLGCWPPRQLKPDDAFRNRIQDHVRKALNEAKRNTHWLRPNEAWLAASDQFVDALLNPATGDAFLAHFVPRATRLAQLGVVNSLAQVALKVTSPGVPDFYQGGETWNLSLVDPDNRHLIDWRAHLSGTMAALARSWADLLAGWADGGIKVRVTVTLLRFRQEHLPLFQMGDYTALTASGKEAHRVAIFRRVHEQGSLVVVVPRLTASLGFPPVGQVWSDTVISLPAGGRHAWRDVFTGEEWSGATPVPLSEILSELPLAVLFSPS